MVSDFLGVMSHCWPAVIISSPATNFTLEANGESLILMPVPLFDHDLDIDPVAKLLQRKTLVSQLAVEAFCRAILSELAKVDQGQVGIPAGGPARQGPGNKFRSVVRARDIVGTVETDQLGQEFHYPRRTDGAGEIDGLAFAGVFVDDCQAFQLLFVGTALEEEAVPQNLMP